MIAPALVSLLLTAVDPCEAVPVDLPPDRATAAAYREVALAEEAADDAQAASIAYREALRRDPADETSRAGLASLCGRRAAGRRFDEGVERMRAGDWAAAAAAFAEARAGRADANAALLEGVARLELGEDARATAALAVAAEDPRLRDAARFHQGLLALRAGSATRAVEAFEDAARGGGRSLATLASQLARQARQAGRLLLVASADVARDSNPGLDDRDPTPDRPGAWACWPWCGPWAGGAPTCAASRSSSATRPATTSTSPATTARRGGSWGARPAERSESTIWPCERWEASRT